MTRDMELVREILFFFARLEPSFGRKLPEVVLEGRDPSIVREHCEMMQEASLIIGASLIKSNIYFCTAADVARPRILRRHASRHCLEQRDEQT
jgi:hypothetical protein